ncbi:replication factor C large subunit [Acanthamoeba castellanii medusavirus]|uniref:Replication factor C subunit 1 n=1 Tax=Acanthamoeba castellanii medusavirus J1 TaxID=3114988 RepID=A0A3T1CXJ3_9VIRU|nr:replication factor C large subunit [Acanthamoeba castellanii medusavirus]BBI30505.1 replication factor C large subunit [Acanthamoeba castellanii medusavirus J1]
MSKRPAPTATTDKGKAAPPAKRARRGPAPEGKPWCLWGKVFLVLESLDRDDCWRLIEQHGGKVAKTATKALTHVITGSDAGPKKFDAAMLDEDGLFRLIQESPQQQPSPGDIEKFNKQRKTRGVATVVSPASPPAPAVAGQLWVERFRPRATAEIVGNATAVAKLREWLKDWVRRSPAKDRKKAVLISGPPGIGKTTSAHLVAAECGFAVKELDASMKRARQDVEKHFAQASETRSILDFMGGASATRWSRTVIVMDEVDGMSTGDNGGIAELIKHIKTASVPIICICNDRTSTKIRTLATHCLDLAFQRPTTKQMVDRATAVLQREAKHLGAETVLRVVEASRGDMRHLINNLQLLTVRSSGDGAMECLASGHKETEVGTQEAIVKLFGGAQNRSLDIDAKLDLYFTDTMFVSLFFHENYLNCRPQPGPHRPRFDDDLELFARAADSLSEADLFDALPDWSITHYHGIMSTVLPANLVCGQLASRINFPQSLASFSTAKRRQRLLSGLSNSIRAVGAYTVDRSNLRLDHVPMLADALTEPLRSRGNDGVEQTIDLMKAYGISRDDLDNIVEIANLDGATAERRYKPIPTAVKNRLANRYKSAFGTTKKGKEKESESEEEEEED